MTGLRNLAPLLPRKLVYCDVGARSGIEAPWSRLRQAIRVIGFEPDYEEWLELRRLAAEDDLFLQTALHSRRQELDLHLTRFRGASSIFKPNLRLMNHFPEMERYEVESTVRVQATTLDHLYRDAELPALDFLKIDVQGAELEVLKGGKSLIGEQAVGLEVEVEFIQMYEDQPLFSDIDRTVVTEFGFQLQDLRKVYWKYREGLEVGGLKGQLVCGDALYLRPVQQVLPWCAGLNREVASEKIQMAVTAALVYGYCDYPLALLRQDGIDKYLSRDKIASWTEFVLTYGKSLKRWTRIVPPAAIAARASILFQALYRLFEPAYPAGGTCGHALGTRKRWGWFQ